MEALPFQLAQGVFPLDLGGLSIPISLGWLLASMLAGYGECADKAWICNPQETNGVCSLHLPGWYLAAELPPFSWRTDCWMVDPSPR
jgi:hypothetical protein